MVLSGFFLIPISAASCFQRHFFLLPHVLRELAPMPPLLGSLPGLRSLPLVSRWNCPSPPFAFLALAHDQQSVCAPRPTLGSPCHSVCCMQSVEGLGEIEMLSFPKAVSSVLMEWCPLMRALSMDLSCSSVSCFIVSCCHLLFSDQLTPQNQAFIFPLKSAQPCELSSLLPGHLGFYI